jgi:hypothetical protein
MKDKYNRPGETSGHKYLKFNQTRLKFNFWFLFSRVCGHYFCQSYSKEDYLKLLKKK